MAITWLKKAELKGNATLTNSYIVVNQSFADRFTNSYMACVGLDEDQNIIIKPLKLDECESPLYKDSLLLKINIFKSFVRLGNTESMKIIKDLINIDIPKNGIKYLTEWSNKENALVVLTKKGEN